MVTLFPPRDQRDTAPFTSRVERESSTIVAAATTTTTAAAAAVAAATGCYSTSNSCGINHGRRNNITQKKVPTKVAVGADIIRAPIADGGVTFRRGFSQEAVPPAVSQPQPPPSFSQEETVTSCPAVVGGSSSSSWGREPVTAERESVPVPAAEVCFIGTRAAVDSASALLGVVLDYMDREKELQKGDVAVRKRLMVRPRGKL